jgi:hypothetical protein
VNGVVLADQVKNLDWLDRRAEFICTPGGDLLEDVIQKAFALLSSEDDEAD